MRRHAVNCFRVWVDGDQLPTARGGREMWSEGGWKEGTREQEAGVKQSNR